MIRHILDMTRVSIDIHIKYSIISSLGIGKYKINLQFCANIKSSLFRDWKYLQINFIAEKIETFCCSKKKEGSLVDEVEIRIFTFEYTSIFDSFVGISMQSSCCM